MSVDTHNRDLLVKIKSLTKTNPNAAVEGSDEGTLTNYEILKMIKDIAYQAKEPEEGTIDLATGLKY